MKFIKTIVATITIVAEQQQRRKLEIHLVLAWVLVDMAMSMDIRPIPSERTVMRQLFMAIMARRPFIILRNRLCITCHQYATTNFSRMLIMGEMFVGMAIDTIIVGMKGVVVDASLTFNDWLSPSVRWAVE